VLSLGDTATTPSMREEQTIGSVRIRAARHQTPTGSRPAQTATSPSTPPTSSRGGSPRY